MTVSDHAPTRQPRTRRLGDDRDPNARPIAVSLVNDYELIVHGLQAMLAPFEGRVTVVELEVEGEPDCRADVALFDTFGGHRHAIERASRMIDEDLVDHVVLYTWDTSSDFVDDARRVGVHGIISKETPAGEVVELLERIVAGERLGFDLATAGSNGHTGRNGQSGNGHSGNGHSGNGHTGSDESPNGDLSDRETEVLALLAAGLSNKQIAREMYLSIETVRTYVRRLYGKLGVKNRAQAAVHATLHGLAPPNASTRS